MIFFTLLVISKPHNLDDRLLTDLQQHFFFERLIQGSSTHDYNKGVV